MAKEATTYPDKSCILFDGMQSSQNTRRLKGLPNSVNYSNGIATFDGVASKIAYPVIGGIKTIRIKINSLASTTQHICKLTSSHSISVSSGTLSARGFSSPTIYVNGAVSSTITTGISDIVITTATAIKADAFILGYITNYLNGSVELIHVFNTVLTASEVSNLYNNRTFAPSSKANLLLDFNSSQGTIKDLTGKNTLTATDITIKKIGKNYAASFNGTTSKIDCGSDIVGIKAVTVCGWINSKTYGESNVGRLIDNNSLLIYNDITNTRYAVSSNSAATNIYSTNTSVSLNKYIFLAITRTAVGVVNFYIGNKTTAPALSGSANQNSGTPVAGTSNLIIGNNTGQTQTFDGLIHSIKIYEGILDLATITQIWSNSLKDIK